MSTQEIPRTDLWSDDRLVLALARRGSCGGVARPGRGLPHGLPHRHQGLSDDTHGRCAPDGYRGKTPANTTPTCVVRILPVPSIIAVEAREGLLGSKGRGVFDCGLE